MGYITYMYMYIVILYRTTPALTPSISDQYKCLAMFHPLGFTDTDCISVLDVAVPEEAQRAKHCQTLVLIIDRGSKGRSCIMKYHGTPQKSAQRSVYIVTCRSCMSNLVLTPGS